MSFYVFAGYMRVASVTAELMKHPNAQTRPYWAEGYPINKQYTVDPNSVCPLCGRRIGSLRWKEPRQFRISGTRYPDHLQYWLAERLVVSERFKDGYEREHLTGIKLFLDTEIVRLTKRQLQSPPPKYYSLVIERTESVRIDMEKTVTTGNATSFSCPLCSPFQNTRKHVERIAFDTTNWNGLDIFIVYGFGIAMSQRMHDFIMDYHLTNFDLVRIEDYRY